MSLRRGLAIASTIALLLVALAAPANATFSGTNGRITFARYVSATNGLEIFSAKPDGSAETQLTSSGQDHNAIFSDWSPDGTKIAFDSDRTDDVQIFIM